MAPGAPPGLPRLRFLLLSSGWASDASRVIAVDTNKFRLDRARDFGATDTVEAGDNTTAEVLALTGGVGVQDMWIQNVTLTMGLVDTVSIPTLLKMVASGRIPAEKMGTHSFTFAQMDEAYDVFKNSAENSALKVVITPA